MNIALWIAAALLALAFFAAGTMKLAKSKEALAEKTPYVEDLTAQQIRAIGTIEVAGAIGVVLPGVTKIATVLVPCAATGLAITMVLATRVHLRRGEHQLIANAILLCLALFVAVGRFGSWPL